MTVMIFPCLFVTNQPMGGGGVQKNGETIFFEHTI